MYEYPFGNGQQLNLDWFLAEWKNLLAAWEAEKNGIEGALQAEIDRAEAALADVFAARDAAAQSAANALESKNAAADSQTAAQNAAQGAAQSETAAGNSASAAAQSETAAGNSASAAAQSETAAGNSASAAAQSETAAGNSASAAAQSAADALADKNAAAQSASDAEDAATSVEASAQQIATNTSDISDLKTAINQNLVYKFNKRILRSGSLQPNGAADNSTHTMTMYNKVFIPANHAIEISLVNTPNIEYDNMQIRVVRFTTDSMLTTPAGTIILNNTITENTVTIPAITTDSYIMVGYYFHLNNTPVNDVLASYNYGITIFEISVVGASDKIYSETNINQLLETILFSIAPVFSGYVAERSLSINDLCIVNNVLYIATANIPDREPLNVGTNIAVTSLNDVIKSLR